MYSFLQVLFLNYSFTFMYALKCNIASHVLALYSHIYYEVLARYVEKMELQDTCVVNKCVQLVNTAYPILTLSYNHVCIADYVCLIIFMIVVYYVCVNAGKPP